MWLAEEDVGFHRRRRGSWRRRWHAVSSRTPSVAARFVACCHRVPIGRRGSCRRQDPNCCPPQCADPLDLLILHPRCAIAAHTRVTPRWCIVKTTTLGLRGKVENRVMQMMVMVIEGLWPGGLTAFEVDAATGSPRVGSLSQLEGRASRRGRMSLVGRRDRW